MKTPQQRKRGSITMGMVFGIGLLGLAVATSTLLYSGSGIQTAGHATVGARTLVVADAAAREGLYQILQDETFIGSTIPSINGLLNAGTQVSGDWPIFEIRGLATGLRTERRVVIDFDLFPSAFAFTHALYSHGQIAASGNLTVNGSSYAREGISLSGNARITGDAYTPLTMNNQTKSRVDGLAYESADTIQPPTINLNPYRTMAIANGTYFTNTNQAAAYIQSNPPNHPTVFVENNGTLSLNNNNLNFQGTIITTGSFSINGGTISSNIVSNPLVLYVTNDFLIRGNANVNGIVYVGGSTTFGNGTNRITGAMLSVQPLANLSVNGNAIVTYDSNYGTAWKSVVGLDKDSGTSPKIRRWYEE